VLKYVSDVRFIDLCVRDTGGGIPREVAERINPDPGFPGRSVRASRGLGLYIARRLVRMHGGSLGIEGSVAEGSAVHLYLPADEETARIVMRYRIAEESVDEMLARGMAPSVYCIEKASPGSWEGTFIAGRPPAAVDPARGEISWHSLRLWPLSESFAVAVGTGVEPGVPPGETLRSTLGFEEGIGARDVGIRYGHSAGPREGLHMRELLAIAEQRMDSDVVSLMRKGERE
jgi:hypothetical protein